MWALVVPFYSTKRVKRGAVECKGGKPHTLPPLRKKIQVYPFQVIFIVL